jgi:hypothetical protein
MYVEQVLRHKTGLEKGWWLLRKLRFVVLLYRKGGPGRDLFENTNCDSRARMLFALVGVYTCSIGAETRNRARKAAVAKKFEKQ